MPNTLLRKIKKLKRTVPYLPILLIVCVAGLLIYIAYHHQHPRRRLPLPAGIKTVAVFLEVHIIAIKDNRNNQRWYSYVCKGKSCNGTENN